MPSALTMWSGISKESRQQGMADTGAPHERIGFRVKPLVQLFGRRLRGGGPEG
jgi:hypothetical protein